MEERRKLKKRRLEEGSESILMGGLEVEDGDLYVVIKEIIGFDGKVGLY